ncbi:MAG: hypothetical protein PUK77_10575, partial [bacterium]|nr:hypothetical protein [bacterium]
QKNGIFLPSTPFFMRFNGKSSPFSEWRGERRKRQLRDILFCASGKCGKRIGGILIGLLTFRADDV